ncbi:MAG: hypothetical protein DLM72_02245 [Candidatus Nitrosopolaris wilkensis]|nr:MAG: hypothetical protein DLM72_02245 [Candidatus Nitrosopolaris wilkensis]
MMVSTQPSTSYISDQPGKGYTAKHAEKTAAQTISVTDLQNINIVGNNIIQHLLMNPQPLLLSLPWTIRKSRSGSPECTRSIRLVFLCYCVSFNDSQTLVLIT